MKGKDYIDKSMWSFFIYMDKLTLKQRDFIKHYLDTGNACESALKAGYQSYHSGYENLKNPQIIDAIYALMDKQGITDKLLLDVLKEGLAASKTISANIIQIKSDDPTVTDKEAHAKTMDFIDVADYQTRKGYLELALKLKGLLTTGNKIEINTNVEFAIDVNLNEKFNKHQSLISERFGIPL